MRQSYSIEQLKDMLHDRIDQLVHDLAPPAAGSYTDKGLYFTLNPGRADRRVGSFCIHVSGPKVGKWADYATGQHGDVLDLIELSLGLSKVEAIKEARRWLGLEVDTPEARHAREAAAERARRRRAEDERRQAEAKAKLRKRAQALFLSAAPGIAGTPVEAYLRARAIDLRALGRQPGAIRHHPECTFYHREDDPETGEVHEVKLKLPAMVASIVNGKGEVIGCHRTYLAIGPDGRWGKARIQNPRSGEVLPAKKVMGEVIGGSIRLSNGAGQMRGRGAPLAACPPGTRVYIAEGIETALSAMILRPEARVLACIALGNMGAVQLPPNVAEVVLITDGDTGPEPQRVLQRAIEAHAAKGRLVRCWASDVPGEDLNDALKRAMKEQGAA